MPDYTQEQLNAINTRGANLLVAAAAGSGKTAVLVERIIKMITDTKKPVDIDTLLVVTFTEQAATEMRLRIGRRLNDLLKEKPVDANLRRQLSLLNKADITTIHAFCKRLVSLNYVELDLDPRFKIGETAELLIIKQELLDDLLEDEYEKNNESFTQLVEIFGGKYKDDALRELIFNVHTFLYSGPWPINRMEEYVRMYYLPEDITLDNTHWTDLFKSAVLSELNSAAYDLSYAREICLKEHGPLKYLDNITDDLYTVKLLTHKTQTNLSKAYEAFQNCSFTRLSTIRKTDDVDENLKETVKNLRKSSVDCVKGLKERYFDKSPEKYLEDLKNLYPMLTALTKLVYRFATLYSAEKQKKDMLDFNDLEQFALKILYREGSTFSNPLESDAAIMLQQKYSEVLTDEYQDSNHIQELILSAVAGKTNNKRFMVGDIKQSIYRFRQANPEIFIDKYNKYSEGSQSSNKKINLYKNFRSRSNLLAGINLLFVQLMTPAVGEITYDQNAALYYGANFPDADETVNVDDTIEMHLIQTDSAEADDDIEDLSKTELEAEFIASKVYSLVNGDNPHYVWNADENKYRPARFSDIVILASSVKAVGGTFAEAFKKYNIPLYVNTSGGYFKSLEILTILSLLQIIDNPKQDLHMVTVLYSPVYNVTCDELVRLRAVKDSTSYYDRICLFLEDPSEHNDTLYIKLSTFKRDLDEFQKMALFTPISELLWIIYDRTHYFHYVGAMQGGSVRQANLRALIEQAVTYETTRFKGLFHFIKYIEKLQHLNTDLSEAKIIAINENVVKMMTIHSSKGLEFPIVIVSMLGKQFNMLDVRKNMILDSDLGFGPQYVDLNYRIKSNTFSRIALARKALIEGLSEQLRVLYVALTRAKEKLILTGSVSSYEVKAPRWHKFADLEGIPLPEHYMVKSKTFLDWIMPALQRQNLQESYQARFSFTLHGPGDIRAASIEKEKLTEECYDYANLLINDDIHNNPEYQKAAQKLSWQYPFKAAGTLPSKISISEIKRLHYLERIKGSLPHPIFPETVDFSPPAFLSLEQKSSGSALGTAIHTVMEHIDFFSHNTLEQLTEFICGLKDKNLISEEESHKIPVSKIISFMESPLAARIKASSNVKREVPFVLALDPYEIYHDEAFKGLNERTLLHGIIDLFFEEDGGLVLVDYKSDYVKDGHVKEIVERYSPQLDIYRKALEATTGQSVKETLLYLFSLDLPIHI